jgi:hypothetical protein
MLKVVLGNILVCEICRQARFRGTHNHILAPNPFIYKVHNKATTQYQQAVGLALGHRLAHQPYSSMRMVLNSSGLRINRTTRPGGAAGTITGFI